MNTSAARLNMLKQQIRACEVRDEQILNVIAKTPRHEYVPEAFKSLAYVDAAIPLAHEQKMLTPQVEASILQALKIQKTDVVLEIGTGTGYMTALLAKLGAFVYSVDIYEDFLQTAALKLQDELLMNIQLIRGDGVGGWREHAPYDVIIVTGALPALPQVFLEQLQPGGRLFAIIGKQPVMMGTLWIRHGARINKTELFHISTKTLIHAVEPSNFKL